MPRHQLLASALLAAVAAAPAPLTAQGAVIEGTLTLSAGPVRKTAPRYASGPQVARGMQEVPAVVYLTGEALAASGGAAAVGVVDVVQRDTAFAPAAVAIRAGTVVRFPNADPFYHNVFSYAGNARFDLGRYPEGELRQVTFDEPGIAHVYCEVHETMRAVVVVTAHGVHAVVRDDGSFRLEGVPPGRHTLVAHHPDLGSLEQVVDVDAGERLTLPLALGGAAPTGR
jgi:plastocyanin